MFAHHEDALPTGRADVHFHVLPGVDDGPTSLEESVGLAQLAVRDGSATVVATPHFRDIDPSELEGRAEQLRCALRAQDVPLNVMAGAELAYDDVASATDHDLAQIAQGPQDAPWLLLEAPLPDTSGTAADLAYAAADLRARGYDVLIAHPERSPALCADEDVIRAELDAGSLLQINASSLLGRHTAADRARALELLRCGRATMVASDAHNAIRGPALSAALRELPRLAIPERAARGLIDCAPRIALECGLRALRSRGPFEASARAFTQ
jgi:protein-tyrosine phosphatase